MKDAKWFILLLFSFLTLMATSSLTEELDRTELLMRIDAIVEEAMARDQVVGTSIGIRKGGEILVAKGYGFADLENDVRSTWERMTPADRPSKSPSRMELWWRRGRGCVPLGITFSCPRWMTTGRSPSPSKTEKRFTSE